MALFQGTNVVFVVVTEWIYLRHTRSSRLTATLSHYSPPPETKDARYFNVER